MSLVTLLRLPAELSMRDVPQVPLLTTIPFMGTKQLTKLFAIALLTLTSMASLAATSNASFKGTYTFIITQPQQLQTEFNSKTNTQVGVCPQNGPPNGYYCSFTGIGEGTIVGSLVADGVGRVTSGTFTQTPDPKSGKAKSSGTLTGTYSIQSNGTGAMLIAPKGAGVSGTGNFIMLLGSGNVAGQTVFLTMVPSAGGGDKGTGVAIKQ
jgi:hypothetical protein